MLSQGNMGAPFYRYTGQVGPRFVKSGSLVEWKWCHYIMAEADINLRPFHTSIFDIYKGFEPLVCCLKGLWVHPYTVTPAKLAPDLGIQVHLRSEHDAITSCFGLISTSDPFIHTYYAYTLSQGHVSAPLYHYTGQVGPRFRDSGSLLLWKWCHNVMFEVNIHFRPLHTSILGIYKVFEQLVCCLKGIWVHPYTVTPAKPTPDLGTHGHLRSGNDVITSWLRLMSTSDHFIHQYLTY